MRDIGLAHPISEAAAPPIQRAEAEAAQPALCPQHGSRFVYLNVPGRVYLCPHPSGLMYWRAGSRVGGMHSVLRFPKNL